MSQKATNSRKRPRDVDNTSDPMLALRYVLNKVVGTDDRQSSKQKIEPPVCYDIDDDEDSSSECSTSSSSEDDDIFFDAVETKQQSELLFFDLGDLTRTHFPDFDLESVPDGELTDVSDDESTIREKEKRYSTKEDQDVAVFLALAKQMSLKSLLHLLQGHVKALNPSSEYLQTYKAAIQDNQILKGRKPCRKSSLVTKKQFRWAEVNSGKVRAVVHEVESWKQYKDLWIRPEDMQAIRSELIETVQFYRKRRHGFMQAVELIAKGEAPEPVIEHHMKMVIDDSYARGLETHIIRFFSDHRRSYLKAVLNEQMECKESDDDYDMTSHCLRAQSLAYSKQSTDFALRMAKCDEIDALKAKMSRWGQ